LRILVGLASVAYVGIWIGGIVVLLGLPMMRALAPESAPWTWGLPVAVTVDQPPAVVSTAWGTARVEVEDARGSLRLPIPRLPWWLIGVLWTHASLGFALVLTFVGQLRRILRSAAEGAPFEPQNSQRLRRLGVLLLAIVVVSGVADAVTAASARSAMAGSGLTVPAGLHLNGGLALLALVLLSLGRVFRRGAALEHEQSLTV
jgi:hypothetical protein